MLLLLVRFEVLLVVTMQIAVLWDVMLYDLMQVYDTSGGICCFRHHGY